LIYNWKKIVIYSLPLLIICIFIEIFAGQILQGGQDKLIAIPIYLVSIPVINSVGGNIGTILGAKIASGLHVGYINVDIKDKKLFENLITSIIMGILTYIILAIIIYYIVLFIGLTMSISLIEFVLVLLTVGIILICIISIASIFTALLSFKKGLDPDDFVAPIVTTIGDSIGIMLLFLIIGVV
jgi:mgtE-like transporter